MSGWIGRKRGDLQGDANCMHRGRISLLTGQLHTAQFALQWASGLPRWDRRTQRILRSTLPAWILHGRRQNMQRCGRYQSNLAKSSQSMSKSIEKAQKYFSCGAYSNFLVLKAEIFNFRLIRCIKFDLGFNEILILRASAKIRSESSNDD